MERPVLTEPGVKYWLTQTLKECRKFKDRNISVIFNISMLVLFFVVVGGFLTYKYKGKLTPSEIAEKNRKKQEYIVSKLQNIALIKNQKSSTMITDLPTWSNHPEIDILERKIYT
tara:strand:+ start:2891 stop:3235 length:345 start_codon:yes stop_codon:yes gene_type:complete